MCDIKYNLLQALRLKLQDRNISNNTVNLTMAVLSIIMKKALRDGIIARNPFEGLEKLPIAKKVRDTFTLQELKNLSTSPLLQKYTDIKDYILFLALTGMRASEALGVLTSDLQQENDIYYINLDKQRQGNNFVPLKTKDSRIIPLCKYLCSIIQKRKYIVFCEGYEYYRIVFHNIIYDKNTHIDIKNRNLSLHSLRHFFATSTKSQGVPLIKVCAVDGHRGIQGTEAIYTHFKANDLQEIVKWQEWLLSQLNIHT